MNVSTLIILTVHMFCGLYWHFISYHYAAKCCLQDSQNSFKSCAIISVQWWAIEEDILRKSLSISPSSHVWWISNQWGWWHSYGWWELTQWDKFCCEATTVSENAAPASCALENTGTVTEKFLHIIKGCCLKWILSFKLKLTYR